VLVENNQEEPPVITSATLSQTDALEAAARVVESFGHDTGSASGIRHLSGEAANSVVVAFKAAEAAARKNLQAGFSHGCHYVEDLRIAQLDKFVWTTYSGANHAKGVEAAAAELERRTGEEISASVLDAYKAKSLAA
jgi:hypothetical protein